MLQKKLQVTNKKLSMIPLENLYDSYSQRHLEGSIMAEMAGQKTGQNDRETNLNLGSAIAQWIRLRLPFAVPDSNPIFSLRQNLTLLILTAKLEQTVWPFDRTDSNFIVSCCFNGTR